MKQYYIERKDTDEKLFLRAAFSTIKQSVK